MRKRARNKGLARLVPVILSFLLVFNGMGLTAFADDDTDSGQQSVEVSEESGSEQDEDLPEGSGDGTDQAGDDDTPGNDDGIQSVFREIGFFPGVFEIRDQELFRPPDRRICQRFDRRLER